MGEVAGRFQDSGNSIFNFSGRVLPLIGTGLIETLEDRINFRV